MTKQDLARQKLETMLQDKVWQPGKRLPTILELAKQFNMTERPIREAIKTLADEHRLFASGGRGIFVYDPEKHANTKIMFLVAPSYILKNNQQDQANFLSVDVYEGALRKIKELDWKEYLFSYITENTNDIVKIYHREKCSGIISIGYIQFGKLYEIIQRLGQNRLVDTQFDMTSYHSNEVRVDFKCGIRSILNKAYDMGHRHMAILYSKDITECTSHLERFREFTNFCQEKNLPIGLYSLVEAGHGELDGYRKTKIILERAPEISLIFAVTDERAKGVLHALNDSGITPGKKISVIGFDNAPYSEALNLATVATPRHEVGAKAVEIMKKLLHVSKPSNYSELLASYPVFRSSLGPKI